MFPRSALGVASPPECRETAARASDAGSVRLQAWPRCGVRASGEWPVWNLAARVTLKKDCCCFLQLCGIMAADRPCCGAAAQRGYWAVGCKLRGCQVAGPRARRAAALLVVWPSGCLVVVLCRSPATALWASALQGWCCDAAGCGLPARSIAVLGGCGAVGFGLWGCQAAKLLGCGA